VGVIRDFNFSSLRNSITPVGLLLQDDPGCISLRISTGNVSGLIRQIESEWKALAPSTPFSYTFMNEEFDRQYSSELRIEQLFISFAVLALFIACLGLFGLSAFAAQQRMKEIGIRKVLGASVNNIMTILSVDFMKLVVLSIIVATPVAWLIMNKWLQNFAYRISMSAWFLITAGGVAILVAFLAVSLQVIKAAAQNPITGLRSE
jgi:putative ABC transport system permease protein